MMRCMAAMLALALVGADRDAAVKAEHEKFAGTWHFDSVEMNGRKFPPGTLKGSELVLEGNRFTMTDPTATYRGTYAVEPAASPKTIDVTYTEGPEKGKTYKGIYELDGDTYKVCMAAPGVDRPKKFATTPGSGSVLEVLKRRAK